MQGINLFYTGINPFYSSPLANPVRLWRTTRLELAGAFLCNMRVKSITPLLHF
jgi:hypothetical protein